MDIHKSKKNKIVGGVCGGLAESMGVSPTLLRILTIIFVPCTLGTFVLVYLALCLFLPTGDSVDEPKMNFSSNSIGEFCSHCGKRIPSEAKVCPFCGNKR